MARTLLKPDDALPVEGGIHVAPAPRLGERLAARGILALDAIPAVLQKQQLWGCRFGEALLAEGHIRAPELAESLAESMGLVFLDLVDHPPDESLLEDGHLDLYLNRLFVPWRRVGEAPVIACADPSPEMRAFIGKLYGRSARMAVTAKFDVIWTVQRRFRERLTHEAVLALDESRPEYSARRVITAPQTIAAAIAAIAFAAWFWVSPTLALAALIIAIQVCYAANIGLRLFLFGAAGLSDGPGLRVSPEEIARLDDADLPVYSILVPLYREANMVRRITDALKGLDYPGLMAQTPQEHSGTRA